MNRILIIYHSKTGFSKRYAQWLAEELNGRILPFRDRKSADLTEYDTIILTGGLYAGQMSGLKWLKKQLPALAGKRLAAVAVGCAPVGIPGQAESMAQLFSGTPEIQGFYCQGGLDYEHMGAVDRAMMAALRAKLRKDPEKAEMLDYITKSFEVLKRESLEPVLAWVRGE